MASIKECGRLLKRITLANLGSKKGLAITPMLEGPHGVGKSQIVKSAATDMGGVCFVVEGGSLKEGEITGLPVAFQTHDGDSEVRFVMYYAIKAIRRLEKAYYEKAKKEGFLNGTVKLNESDDLIYQMNGKEYVVKKNLINSILGGEENMYKFGEDLPKAIKLQLLNSGEIAPAFLFIDELNRTDTQTQRELMNIILNKNVNGYDLPWWLTIVSAINPSSQDSMYATNEIDPAQLDRFLKLKATANIEDWVDYCLSTGVDTETVEGVAMASEIFMTADSKKSEGQKMTPSPRSWEMVANIVHNIYDDNNTRFFDSNEKAEVEKDLRTLIAGKVGDEAARTFISNIKNKENNTPPKDIINGKSKNIAKDVVEKFNRQSALRQKITTDMVLSYLAENIVEVEKKLKSTDAKNKEFAMNYYSQIKEFINELLKPGLRVAAAKKMLDNPNLVATDGMTLFRKISSSCFAKELYEELVQYTNSKNVLSKE